MRESNGWGRERLVLADPSVGPSFDVRSKPGKGGWAWSVGLGDDDVFYGIAGAVVRAKLGEPDVKAERAVLQRITPDETNSNPGIKDFGDRVSVGGDVAVVEAPRTAVAPVPLPATRFAPYGTKSAFLFERRSGTWQFKQTLSGLGPCAVSSDGSTVACRSPSGGVRILGPFSRRSLARRSDGRRRGDRLRDGARRRSVGGEPPR
jgi:hypothetical protein